MPRTSWLWGAVLLVLCLSAMAGAAPGADSWKAVGSDFPSALIWEQVDSASVDAQNNGTTTWNSSYLLRAVQGPTASAFAVDRWGTTGLALATTVVPGATYRFAFGITAPPITTLDYALPLTPTSVPEVAALASDWMLANGATLVRTAVSSNGITIGRFLDMLPGGEAWAAPYVEELAGHVPVFVQGFREPDGTFTYRPGVNVTRDQMAVFIARALAGGDQNVPTGPAKPTFPDVGTGYWAYKWIEAAVAQGVVVGYLDGTYQPRGLVTRDQMAVFVARAIAGGDSLVPTGPAKAKFPDVATNYWAFKYVEFAVGKSIVNGFPDGNYQPLTSVTRDQMSVFIYRTFVQPTGSLVVLAGPALTAVNPDTAVYDGWSSLQTATVGSKAIAYIGFDAVRGSPALAPITVGFVLRSDSTPTAVVTGQQVISAVDIAAAKAEVVANGGNPYAYAFASLDLTGLPVGKYTLTVSVKGNAVPRTFPITLTAAGG